MQLLFHLKYSSQWGQQVFVCGNHTSLGNNDEAQALPLQYINNQLWNVEIQVSDALTQPLDYYYFILNQDGTKLYCALKHTISANYTSNRILTLDQYVNTNEAVTNFLKKPFTDTFFNKPTAKATTIEKTITHIITVAAPQLTANYTLCIVGSSKKIGAWDVTQAKVMRYHKGFYTVVVNLPKSDNKLVYKYGVYDSKHKAFVQYEEGENRVLLFEREEKELFVINDGLANLPLYNWKGAGVAIPVFSLRSKNGCGVGEFSDIKLLANWSSKVGLKLIQLLPINDTIVTKTNADSYPYAANSSFALHPLYINLHEVGILGKESKSETSYARTQRKLNKLDSLDYAAVLKFKLQYLKELYQTDKGGFLNNDDFITWFDANKYWLQPYSVYCYLRDKFKTTDFSKWGTHTTIDDKKIAKLTTNDSKQFAAIAFWYYVQYHLHLQLKAAVDYAHSLGIVLKGDIPIGIGRTSCDAWQHPHLFNMNEQAGAPPDDFAVKGQNWGFPTYNWAAMQQDGFKWWKNRFAKMSDYFDAFRIDHILGFFRIWSIPLNAVEGIMGHFIPAIPVHKEEFAQSGIYLDVQKFTQPHFTQPYIDNIFNENTDDVKATYFDQKNEYWVLKNEFSTQQMIARFFAENNIDNEVLKIKLFDAVSNVILFEEVGSEGNKFHFNIAMHKTHSFSLLAQQQQDALYKLYINYFYERQDNFWKIEANKKIPSLQQTTDMLICGEDLGMVPHCVPGVMSDLSMLSLEVQRMPKATGASFVNLNNVPYLSVATPSTHDMSTIRGWWEEDRNVIQQFYNQQMGKYGEAPQYAEPWVIEAILQQHLNAPSMWSIFQWQDIISLSTTLRRENPNDDRINVPANPNHYWCYRMHIKLEDLIKEKEFNTTLQDMVTKSGR